MKFSVTASKGAIVLRWTLSLPPDDLLVSAKTHMSIISIGSALHSQFQAFGEGSLEIPTNSKICDDQTKWEFHRDHNDWLLITIPKETGYSF
jgi:hypothetical protein